MIAVIFEPRFGSSKVMQALADSGYPVIGEKFPSWFSKDELSHNPLGFWEHPDPTKAVKDGVGNAAIKLRTSEALSVQLPSDVRFVICMRDYHEATASQIKTGFLTWPSIEVGAMNNQALYTAFWTSAKIRGHDVKVVEHSDWLKNPEKEKAKLLEWANGIR